MNEDRERSKLERQGAGEIAAVLMDDFERNFPTSRTSTVGLEAALLAGLPALIPALDGLFVGVAALGVMVARQEVLGAPVTSWATVEFLASDWARRQPDIVMAVLHRTTSGMIRKEMAAFLANGETIPQLRQRLQRYFDVNRARRIATTETTRVFAEASTISYEQVGIPEVQWMTANDDRVCPICAPLGGLKFLDGSAIPAREALQEARAVIAPTRGRFVHPGGLGNAGAYDGMTFFPPAHVLCRCRIRPVV